MEVPPHMYVSIVSSAHSCRASGNSRTNGEPTEALDAPHWALAAVS